MGPVGPMGGYGDPYLDEHGCVRDHDPSGQPMMGRGGKVLHDQQMPPQWKLMHEQQGMAMGRSPGMRSPNMGHLMPDLDGPPSPLEILRAENNT